MPMAELVVFLVELFFEPLVELLVLVITRRF